ncbi:MAG: S41 family peptidase [Flavobacteriaceae bacterium]
MKKFLFAVLIISLSTTACSNPDIDDNQVNVVADPEPTDSTSDTTSSTTETDSTTGTSTTAPVTANTEVNDYIWKGLNLWYYWQEEVDNLADTVDDNQNSYTEYLNSIADPEDFFDSLNHPDDRFSWIDPDYENLEDQLAGISASNGMKFLLYRRCSGCETLIGAVTYVLPNSDAANKGVVRGDLFNRVDGQELNLTNYISLLYGQSLNYSIDLVNYDAATDVVVPREITIDLVKEENFQEEPIHKNVVVEHNGTRVGYLMYNKFVGAVDSNDDGVNEYDFDQALIDAFASFQSENISELVVDLRYNGGGSVRTCTYLASLITGQFTGTIFAQQQWNSKLMAYFDSVNTNSNPNDDFDLNDYFVDTTHTGVSIQGLQLNRVYILTSNRSASASELLINGLSPHINVVQVGTATYGKNVGSITIYDYIDNSGDVRNPNHTYAMQPIVLKIANSENFADYTNGLDPDIELRESASSYGVLGDVNEPLFAAALNHISGGSSKRSYDPTPFELIKNPQIESQQRMFVDLPKGFRLPIEN